MDFALAQHDAERVQRVLPELRQLVEEQDAAVRQAHLAGTRHDAATADEPRLAHRVVRCAQGNISRPRQTGHTPDGRQLDEVVGDGQECVERPRGQRLAAPRRTHEEDRVSAGSGDFDRSPDSRILEGLPVRVVAAHRLVAERAHRFEAPPVAHAAHDLVQRPRQPHVPVRLAQRRVRIVAGWQHELAGSQAVRRAGQGDAAADRTDRAVEPELADEHVVLQVVRRHPAQRSEHGQRDRDIEAGDLGWHRFDVDVDGPSRS